MAELSTLVPVATIERHRYMREHGEEPDVLVAHPDDLRTMAKQISESIPWVAELGTRKLWGPPAEEVAYGQFLGMDIVPSWRMSPGYIVVGKRVAIAPAVVPG